MLQLETQISGQVRLVGLKQLHMELNSERSLIPQPHNSLT